MTLICYYVRMPQVPHKIEADMIALQAELEAAIAEAVCVSRERHDRSWSDIGRAAGTSRQAAQVKWGRNA